MPLLAHHLDLPTLRGLSRALVVGMGRSGQEAARLLLALGLDAVACTDSRADAVHIAGTRALYGGHDRSDFLDTDLVVVSPGVPGDLVHLEAASAHGVPVIGELGLAAAVLQSPELPGGPLPMVAVTGTNGKSSTTFLLGQLLEQAGRRPFVGGNLGAPLSLAARSRLDGDLRHDCAVVEVSSYQLERPGPFHPVAGAVLNLSPDHLARHGDMATYASTKLDLFGRMTPEDRALLPADDPWLPRTALAWRKAPPPVLAVGAHPGVTVEGDRLVFSGTDDDGALSLVGFGLPGGHNRLNLAAALLLGQRLGLDRAAVDLAALRPLPHRMEPIETDDGRTWINDSKATNVDAARAGLAGAPAGAVVLLGGAGKAGADYGVLAQLLTDAGAVICFGATGPAIAQDLRAAGLQPLTAPTLADAVARARAFSAPGDAVLLCPACASFDEFDNFEHRGRVFADLARGESP